MPLTFTLVSAYTYANTISLKNNKQENHSTDYNKAKGKEVTIRQAPQKPEYINNKK